jgi:hypothetical protein
MTATRPEGRRRTSVTRHLLPRQRWTCEHLKPPQQLSPSNKHAFADPDNAWKLRPFDHRIDRLTTCAEQGGRLIDG